MEEVKRVIFGLGSDNSPRPDGFLALFYQKFWDILAKDILDVVGQSRKGGFVLKDFNNTFLPLISKKVDYSSFDDFHPISLSNTIYKVISKVIANRLKLVLESKISSKQSGFAPGRSIYEGIILAREVFHSIQMERIENMMVKVDIRKACDEVNRNFLVQVMSKFGFSAEWISWINSCISSPQFFVIINGIPQGFFESKKGIQQGVPLSPFPFIIMVDVLGRLISKGCSEGLWKGIKIVDGVNPLTHSQFVDDTFLAKDALGREARFMKRTLDDYKQASG